MFVDSVLSDVDADRILHAALEILDRSGMMFQNARILDALERLGARVDRAAELARLPRELVREVIEQVRGQAGLPSPPERFVAGAAPSIGVQVAQFYLDWAARERRSGNRADFETLIRFGSALDIGPVGHALLMTDVDYRIEPLEAVLMLVRYARQPGQTYPHFVEQFDYLAEMGEIYCGERSRFLTGGVFITSPLRLCRRAADFLARRVKSGMGCGTSSMPVVGASVPVTIAGAAAVSAAELLGAWTAVKALNPEARVSGGIGAGVLDMRTGNVSFCAPEAMLLNFAVICFFRRVCRYPMHVAGASDYCDARWPSLYAAFEKAHKAMLCAAFYGQHAGVGQGMLEGGKTFSPVQFLLDREVAESVRRLARPVVVDDATLPLDAILEVGQGLGQSYIESPHTLAHFRRALCFPEFLDRTTYESYEREQEKKQAVLTRAQARFEEILGHYRPPEVDEKVLRALETIVRKAERDLQRQPC